MDQPETPQPDPDSDGDLDDVIRENPLLVMLVLDAIRKKEKKKKKKKRADGKPSFPRDQEGLMLPSHGEPYPFTWDEMTTNLAGIGFAFGDILLYKPKSDLCRAIAFETEKDRLWTTSVAKKNCVAMFPDFAEHRDDFEKYVE